MGEYGSSKSNSAKAALFTALCFGGSFDKCIAFSVHSSHNIHAPLPRADKLRLSTKLRKVRRSHSAWVGESQRNFTSPETAHNPQEIRSECSVWSQTVHSYDNFILLYFIWYFGKSRCPGHRKHLSGKLTKRTSHTHGNFRDNM